MQRPAERADAEPRCIVLRSRQGRQPDAIVRLERSRFDGVLFDMDGVITSTRTIHEKAWGAALSELLAAHAEPPMSHTDYRVHIDGRRREDGARLFLSARGVPVGDEMIATLSAAKNAIYQAELARSEIRPLAGVATLLTSLGAAGMSLGLFTASRNATAVLAAAGLDAAFGAVVDGNLAAREGLPGKPAPDVLLACAARLDLMPSKGAVFEDAVAGIEAACAGGFALVVGVGDGADGRRLVEAGADAVVPSLCDVAVLP